jgi:DnaJ-class molecular chaperone
MNANDFVDYYELLELSPKASFDTIERVFRYLATVHHPDFAQDVDLDKHHFSQIIEAFETLLVMPMKPNKTVKFVQKYSQSSTVKGEKTSKNPA